jgi:hypothetical protein
MLTESDFPILSDEAYFRLDLFLLPIIDAYNGDPVQDISRLRFYLLDLIYNAVDAENITTIKGKQFRFKVSIKWVIESHVIYNSPECRMFVSLLKKTIDFKEYLDLVDFILVESGMIRLRLYYVDCIPDYKLIY